MCRSWHEYVVIFVAVEALEEIAEKGDAQAIATVGARLEDSSCRVRLAAVEVLSQIAAMGGQSPSK